LNDVDPVLETETEMVVTDDKDKEMVVTVAAATADAHINPVPIINPVTLNDVDPVLQTNTEMVVTDDKDKEMVVTVAAATADARIIKMVYGLYRTYGDGLGGNVDGVDGSLSPASLTKAFELLGVNRNTKLTDLGAGAGRPVLAAGEVGADESVGVELPANVGQQLIFEAVRSKLPDQERAARCTLTMANIDDLTELPPGTDVAFTFWVGMHPETQRRILSLAARCPTLRALAVFKTHDFGTIDTVLDALNATERDGSQLWEYSATLRTTMMGSAGRHTMWAFTRRIEC
jgi:hypothetical protein